MSAKIEISSDYEKVVKECKLPVIVIIIANWCGTCHIMAPILDKLAEEYHEKVKFIIADIDASENIAKSFGSDKLPIILFFNQGIAVDRLSGTIPYSLVEIKIKELLRTASKKNN